VIAGPSTNRTACNIRKALVSGLVERGLQPCAVTHSNYHLDSGASAVQEILAVDDMPTVIFCGSDLIAMGAMLALEEAGLEVPRDVSIVGIDDISFSVLARPPLTTISVPREEVGVVSFQALDKMAKLKRQRGADYSLDTSLVVRKSTAGARKRGKLSR
jgi:DNA-binding LacI/PurR family transcriptional regulator